MSSHPTPVSAHPLADSDPNLVASQPAVARVPADPLADAVRLAIASLLPGGEALRSLENDAIVPTTGLNVPETVQ